MGRQKESWLSQELGCYESKEGIAYNQKLYVDSGSEYVDISYSLIDCPHCEKKLLEKYENDSTPGFRDRSRTIIDRMCECHKK
ncbi:MAG: hypothetical protein ACRCWG_03180 [Sarcina sp.]